MEQNLNDKPLSNMQIARYIESLRKEMNFDDEVYGLVKSDLEDGLTQEQTEKYLDKNFNIGQMRVLSEGLHKGIPEELFNILHNNKLSGNQMKVSLEFYEKGVPVETIHRVFQILKNIDHCAAWSNRLLYNGRKQNGKSYDVNLL